MQRLSLIQLSLIVFWRDLVSPGVGLYLLAIDPSITEMAAWHAPIVAGLVGFPLAARGLTKKEPE